MSGTYKVRNKIVLHKLVNMLQFVPITFGFIPGKKFGWEVENPGLLVQFMGNKYNFTASYAFSFNHMTTSLEP